MTKGLFDKYIWLVDTIHRAGRITLREINEKWAMSPLYDGADIPRRTFNNWKEAIQQAFDINIECRRVGGYHYYIENPEDLENSTFHCQEHHQREQGHPRPHPPGERTLRAEAPHPHHRRHAGK